MKGLTGRHCKKNQLFSFCRIDKNIEIKARLVDLPLKIQFLEDLKSESTPKSIWKNIKTLKLLT